MNRILFLALIMMMPSLAPADEKMDVLLQRGVSEYEGGNFVAALDHFTAALVHGTQAGESLMYPASYLCASWYFGNGVDKNLSRAESACRLAQGDKEAFQVEIFQGVLEKNSAEDSTFTFKKAMADAATALEWYLQNHGGNR